jgi:DUF4097 and DUF4098 domain-containing protein YvlB
MDEKGYTQTISTADFNETPRFLLEQPTGDVMVEGWDRPEISVSVDDKEGYFELEQSGSTVTVHNRPGRFNVVKFLEPAQEELREFGIEVDRVAARIERQVERQVRRAGRRMNMDLGLSAWRGGRDYYIRVPHDCDLNLRTSSGDIRVMGVRGNLFVQTTSGDVRVRSLAGNLIFNSASGDLYLEEFRGKLGLRTASGDIKARGLVLTELNVQSASGDLELDMARIPEAGFEVRTISGELELRMPHDARFHAEIHTVSGTIKTGYRRQQVDFRTSTKRETVLDVNGGGGAEVRLQTVSGDIYIHPRRQDESRPEVSDFGWQDTAQSRHAGHPEQGGAYTMDLSRNPEYARVAPAPAEPSPERRAAELEILQKVQSGELSPQEAVQRLSALDGGAAPAQAQTAAPAVSTAEVSEATEADEPVEAEQEESTSGEDETGA